MKTKIGLAAATAALSGSLLCAAGAAAEFDIVIYGSSPAAMRFRRHPPGDRRKSAETAGTALR